MIVEAARRLVDEKGDQFTTQELAREAGVALQTFYRHFPGKDQLLVAVIEDMIAENAERYAAAASHLSDPVARLRFYVTEILSGLTDNGGADAGGVGVNGAGASGAGDGGVGDLAARVVGATGADGDAADAAGRLGTGPRFITAQHWRLHQRFPEDMAHAIQPITDLIARELREAQAAGLLHPIDPDRDAALITKLIMTVYHHYAFAPAGEATAVIAEHVWSFCLTGLGGAAPAPATRSTTAAATRAPANAEHA